MCRAMEEMVKETAFKTRVEAATRMMKRFNITAQEALETLGIPESEYDRYIAAM